MRRSVVCTLRSAAPVWVSFVRNRDWHSRSCRRSAPLVSGLSIVESESRERQSSWSMAGACEVRASVERNFVPFAGQVTGRLGSSSEFSGRGHGLEALATATGRDGTAGGFCRATGTAGRSFTGVAPCTGWGRPAILGGAGMLLLSSSLQVVTRRPYPICRCRVCLRTNRTNTDMPPTSSAGLQSRVLASVLMSTTGPLPPHSCHDIGHWTRTRSSVAATQNHLFATSLELPPETPTGITQSSIKCQSPHGGSWSLHNHPLP